MRRGTRLQHNILSRKAFIIRPPLLTTNKVFPQKNPPPPAVHHPQPNLTQLAFAVKIVLAKHDVGSGTCDLLSTSCCHHLFSVPTSFSRSARTTATATTLAPSITSAFASTPCCSVCCNPSSTANGAVPQGPLQGMLRVPSLCCARPARLEPRAGR